MVDYSTLGRSRIRATLYRAVLYRAVLYRAVLYLVVFIVLCAAQGLSFALRNGMDTVARVFAIYPPVWRVMHTFRCGSFRTTC